MSGPETVYPVSKLGEYKICRNIAEGTFGKVKSKSFQFWRALGL
jgi:hypothetical protein